jgi:hypothetical protein
MFEDAEKKSTKVDAEDIFSAVELTANEPVNAPLNSPTLNAPKPMPMAPAYSAPTGGSNKTWKMAVIILVVLIVLVLLVILGRFLYNKMVNPAAPAVVPIENLNLNQPINEPALNIVEPTPINEPVVEIDSDFDGLSDAREAELGTNSQLPDTDGDGLFDRQEADVYKTDPLNPDTDGDTYQDGDEVKNGYNPNGPGKLYTLPATTPAQ